MCQCEQSIKPLRSPGEWFAWIKEFMETNGTNFIVMNPSLAVPFIIAPMVSAAIGYVLTAIGFTQ